MLVVGALFLANVLFVVVEGWWQLPAFGAIAGVMLWPAIRRFMKTRQWAGTDLNECAGRGQRGDAPRVSAPRQRARRLTPRERLRYPSARTGNHRIRPITGSNRISTTQITLAMVEAPLCTILTIAQTFATRRMSPNSPPTSIPTHYPL